MDKLIATVAQQGLMAKHGISVLLKNKKLQLGMQCAQTVLQVSFPCQGVLRFMCARTVRRSIKIKRTRGK